MTLPSNPRSQFQARETKVYIASQRPIIGAGLTALIESWYQFEVIEKPGPKGTSLLVADMDSLKAPVTRLLSLANTNQILMVADSVTSPGVIDGLKIGIQALALTDQSPNDLRNMLTRMPEGRLSIDARIVQYLVTENTAPKSKDEEVTRKFYSLTDREQQIAALTAAGQSTEDIATTLNITQTTVRFHLTNIFNKLDVPSTPKLIAYLYLNDLVRNLPQPGSTR